MPTFAPNPSDTQSFTPIRVDKPQVATTQGARDTQEDRSLVLSVERKAKTSIPERGWFMAIMDGHGGPDCAQAVHKLLPKTFQAAFKEKKGDYTAALRQTVALLTAHPDVKTKICSGTTLSIAYTASNLPCVYVAHLGDSPVMLFDAAGNILFRTEEHNVVTNPSALNHARRLCEKRHGVDRLSISWRVSRTDGSKRPRYIKDTRMEHDFEAMSQEILDTIEKTYLERGEEYPMEQIIEDGKIITDLMHGKGLQNTAELGAMAFDAILSREPDIAEIPVDPNRLPVYLLLATDGILDINPGATLAELEAQVAKLVAVNGESAEDLIKMAGGDDAPDNTTVILFKIES